MQREDVQLTSLETDDKSRQALRIGVYLILCALAFSWTISRVATVKSTLGKTPLLSANDRSRWSTVRALVDHGTFALDDVIFQKDGKPNREWYTIDMVVHRGPDGREHYYSSKPPLLATIVAAEYWLVKKITNLTLDRAPFAVVRILLVVSNVLPMLLMWWLLIKLLERCGQTDWGRMYVVAAVTSGTFLTTFAVTLNNHLPAAIGTAVTGYALWRITADRQRQARYFAIAGFASAFTAANELPALMLPVGSALVAFMTAPRRAAWAFTLPVLAVAAASLATNYIAHQDWRPPYLHRHDGELLAQFEFSVPISRQEETIPADLLELLAKHDVHVDKTAVIKPREERNRWMLQDTKSDHRYALSLAKGQLQVHAWDNWYEYDGSYWTTKNKKGVDRGEASRLTYAFHVLLGHHGVFSLTPIWLLSVWGSWIWLRHGTKQTRLTVLAILAMTLVCMIFYLMRPQNDRNYGGVSVGFRWLFWLIPLWLFCMIPAADRMACCRTGRCIAVLLLALSVFSAMYGANNPWSHPWVFDLLSSLGWIHY